MPRCYYYCRWPPCIGPEMLISIRWIVLIEEQSDWSNASSARLADASARVPSFLADRRSAKTIINSDRHAIRSVVNINRNSRASSLVWWTYELIRDTRVLALSRPVDFQPNADGLIHRYRPPWFSFRHTRFSPNEISLRSASKLACQPISSDQTSAGGCRDPSLWKKRVDEINSQVYRVSHSYL